MNLRLTALLIASLTCCTVAGASELPAVVLLPMDNISGASEAPQLVRAALATTLERRGWRVINEDDAVEQVLERNRVRYMDSVTDSVRIELTKATHATALMLATISTFRGGRAAVVTLSARLIGADGAVLWSNAAGAHADDTEPLWGGPRRIGPADVTRAAVDALTRDLPAAGRTAPARLSSGGIRRRPAASFVARELVVARKPRICVLPFDNGSQTPEAALVLANAFALRLAAAGNFEVVEPAELREASVRARIGSFRSLGSQELVRLGKIVGTPLFLRGNISKYLDASARSDDAIPELELDLFLVDVDAGRVLWSASHARTGADYAGLLLLGGVSDAATLADRVVCELAVAEGQAAQRNTEWAASHPHPMKPDRRQILAATAGKE